MRLELKQKVKSTFKKIGATALSAALAATMVVTPTTAFAASDYQITISNAQVNATYTAYKVFDANYNDESVAYTIADSSPWYTALNSADTSSLFTFTQIGSTSNYAVTFNTENNQKIIELFEGITLSNYDLVNLSSSYAVSQTADSSTLVLDVTEAGYYYVATTTGSVVSLTTANPTATIVDKNDDGDVPDNNTSTESVEVSTSNLGLGTSNGTDEDDENYYTQTSATIGDTLDFVLYMKASYYKGAYTVTSHVLEVAASTGLSIDTDSVVISFYDNNDTKLDSVTISNKSISTDGISFELNPATDDVYIENYQDTAVYVCVKFSATLTQTAEYTNTVSLTMDTTTDATSDNTSQKSDSVNIYTYGFNMKVVDSEDTSTLLEGGQFTLYNATSGEAIYVTLNGALYTVESEGEANVVSGTKVMVAQVNEDKGIFIFGLEEGTYTLEENEAPLGYNPITESAEVTIASASADSDGYMTSAVIVSNVAGTMLPSTGGAGVYALYALGIAAILSAAGMSVVRRRKAIAE